MLQRDVIAGAHEVTKTHVAEAYDASSFARSERSGLLLILKGGYEVTYTLRYTQIPNTKTWLWPTDVVRLQQVSSISLTKRA